MAAFAPTRALGTSGYQLAIHRSHFRFYSLSKTQAGLPPMECEALLYPISNSVKDAANSGFAAALRQIAGQARSHNDG